MLGCLAAWLPGCLAGWPARRLRPGFLEAWLSGGQDRGQDLLGFDLVAQDQSGGHDLWISLGTKYNFLS